jgi:hypothetical protein
MCPRKRRLPGARDIAMLLRANMPAEIRATMTLKPNRIAPSANRGHAQSEEAQPLSTPG